ncbi:DUF4197 domain-containing protein [Mariprofundus erugo]|uniref:DUF4197 domain-containing protein n=1 Tax=Mariprofundus erugo TaxID=2528639 RepID=UPI0010FD73AB|nr:DUF4197 domain-containing protein [Mariprofundus erugo]TLS74262.1 DUF4197 domain-containing protein [Mariprofundus erugo]
MKQRAYNTLIATIVACTACGTASAAGWMDQATGLLNQLGNASQTATPATSQGSNSAMTNLSNSDVVAGLKDALRVGSERVVAQLGKADGFNADPKIHIPLPESMLQVKRALTAVGMGSMMDDLELRLNRAAEAATPKARTLFANAIKAMSFDDAKKILSGPDDAATRYFRDKMSKPLSDEMKPVIEKAMAEAGVVQAYDAVMGKYQSMPLVPDVKANLTGHVIDGGLNGIFTYMASEEAAIRHNPVERTTSILKKVFAGQ